MALKILLISTFRLLFSIALVVFFIGIIHHIILEVEFSKYMLGLLIFGGCWGVMEIFVDKIL